MGLFKKGETHIIAKLHRTDVVICKTPSYTVTEKYGTSKIVTIDILRIVFASLAISTLCLILPFKHDIKEKYHGILFVSNS